MEIKNYKKLFDGREYDCLEVFLPKTTFLVISTGKGFVMCGALDTDMYCTPKMVERGALCAKAVGVKTIDELYEGKVHSGSTKYYELGLKDGMPIKEALQLI